MKKIPEGIEVMKRIKFICAPAALMLALMLVLAACGKKTSAEDTAKDAVRASIDAHNEANHLEIHMDVVQNVEMEGTSMKQTATSDISVNKEPHEIYLDGSIESPALHFNMGFYRANDSYYMKTDELGEDWVNIDDPEVISYLGDSLIMDYDKPNVYLQMLLDDANKMTAQTKDGEIRISVAEPTEKTKEAIASYFLDNLKDSELEGLELKSVDIQNMVIIIDEETSLIQSITMDQIIKLTYGDNNKLNATQTLDMQYSGYDNTEVELPDDLKAVLG
ncbi:MAG: hypothetical protein P0Y55_17750 [Candidatus Cohnella colombiensis]|uniref:Uncharacterized protein n=1 Tax=Candidatus Cohnella colombiensis TaxID=3121368 RepID=A0AA95JFK9_9BACL|nr:MAG: hypothetical protein P0Y55_17750 [Cohnella sp.]